MDSATLYGRPKTKKRPRRTDAGHVYTPSTEDEKRAAFELRARLKDVHISEPAIVCITFYGAHPSADLDNLGKFYLDALVRAHVLKDDRLVVGLWLEKKAADELGPRTVIAVDRDRLLNQTT